MESFIYPDQSAPITVIASHVFVFHCFAYGKDDLKVNLLFYSGMHTGSRNCVCQRMSAMGGPSRATTDLMLHLSSPSDIALAS